MGRNPSVLHAIRALLGILPPAALLLTLFLMAPANDGDPVAGPAPSAWMDCVVPPRPPADEGVLEFGEELYGWQCLPCHGPDGKGDGPNAKRLGLRPRDFTRGLFRFKTSIPGQMPFDEDLYRTLSVGIPAAGMPSFQKLGSKELWAILSYVKSLSVRELPDGSARNIFEAWPATRRAEISPPAESVRIRTGRGGIVYGRSGCAQCHGPSGEGDGPSAKTLQDSFGRPIPVPDFRRGEVEFKAGSAPRDVYRVLTVGLSGTPMPSFASISPRDRWDLANHVASLYGPVHPGEKVYIRKGCINCHTIGKGRHLGPDLAGVGRRRDPEWIRKWIRDPLGLIRVDAEAQALLKEYGLPMPDLKLKEEEIEAVVDFLRALP